MIYNFESLFANRLYEFIQQKNAVGFLYTESTRLLSEFDRFCLEQFPNEATLTKEICLAWAIRRDTEGNNTFRNRLMPVREFARYLNRCGEPAFVLHPNFAKKGPRHIPHIYSEEEIVALWEALDFRSTQAAKRVSYTPFCNSDSRSVAVLLWSASL